MKDNTQATSPTTRALRSDRYHAVQNDDTIKIGDQVSFMDEIEGQRLFGSVIALPNPFGLGYLVSTNAFDMRGQRLVPARLITKEVG